MDACRQNTIDNVFAFLHEESEHSLSFATLLKPSGHKRVPICSWDTESHPIQGGGGFLPKYSPYNFLRPMSIKGERRLLS